MTASAKATDKGTDELGEVASQPGGQHGWVAIHGRGCDRDLQPLDVSGASVRRAGSTFPGDFPAASGDGQYLAYARSSDGAGCNGEDTLLVRTLSTGAERTWSPDPAGNVFIEGLSWGPDDRRLAVLTVLSGNDGLTRVVRVLDTTAGSTLADAVSLQRRLPPDSDYNEVGWLGDRVIANVVCCRSGLADELGIFGVEDGANILTPPRACAAQPFGAASGNSSGSVTSILGMAPCPIVDFDVDSAGKQLLLVDRDGNARVWVVGSDSGTVTTAGTGLVHAAWLAP